MDSENTIVALSTPKGEGAIGVIRLSGKDAVSIALKSLDIKSKTLKPRIATYAPFIKAGKVLDEVIAVGYSGPNSYTGEDIVEISFHGSSYILSTALNELISNGAKMALPGEFTQRAFLNGKMDLSQAEAVADIISSENESQHKTALSQMRGGVSNRIKEMRQLLIDFASLIELELDFSEEDVEFADRGQLISLIDQIMLMSESLIQSFKLGNAIKNGVPVTIAGKPNVGKSTLLNALVRDDRAIVSDIAGTTRDTVEDECTLGGIKFRFIDTAGLRDTNDSIETIGISRSYDSIRKAQIVVYMFESGEHTSVIQSETNELLSNMELARQSLVLVANKKDITPNSFESLRIGEHEFKVLAIEAKEPKSITPLENHLVKMVMDRNTSEDLIITNTRHITELQHTLSALNRAKTGVQSSLSGDLVAADIREALHHLGNITGEVTTEDLLGNIFGNFCIGK